MNDVPGPVEAASLAEMAEAIGLPLDQRTLSRLTAYLGLLQRWNATYNLTAVRDPQAMLTQHLADCVAIVPSLQRELGTAPRRVLDVGSGGGLPGVVIAALCPAWDVVCVDTVGKKAAFIRQAALELKLPNLHAEHARVERLSAGSFDLVTARAFASLADLVALTERHLSPSGVWVAMKGKVPDSEIAALPVNVAVFHVEQLKVHRLDADRCLVWMRRAAPPAARS